MPPRAWSYFWATWRRLRPEMGREPRFAIERAIILSPERIGVPAVSPFRRPEGRTGKSGGSWFPFASELREGAEPLRDYRTSR